MVSKQNSDTVDIIDGFYNAASGEITWADALNRYGRSFPSLKIALCGYEGRLDDASVMAHANYDSRFTQSYEEYYYELNPWKDLLMTAPVAPSVIWAHELMSFEAIKHTEFYNDFLHPQEDVATGFASTLFREEDRFFVVTANVAYDRLDEARIAARSFEAFGPHLRKAFELFRRLGGRRVLALGLEQALHSMRTAAFVLDGQGRIVFANAEAEDIAKRSDIVRVGFDRHLRFASHKDQQAVSKHCFDFSSPSARGPGLFVQLERPIGRPYVAFVSPVPNQDRCFPEIAASYAVGSQGALILLIDPRSEPVTDEKALSEMLRISRAEAGLALALLNNTSAKDYAEQQGLSYHTVRNHLKSLMEKTGTHRQVELVNLLSRMLTAVRLTNPRSER